MFFELGNFLTEFFAIFQLFSEISVKNDNDTDLLYFLHFVDSALVKEISNVIL